MTTRLPSPRRAPARAPARPSGTPLARTAARGTAAGALLLLTACGGDDAPVAPVTTTVTQSAPSSDAPSSAPGSSAPAGSAPPAASAPAGGPADAADPEAELDVEDQRGDGASVRVDDVRLSTGDGWLVVTGADGAVLGSVAVPRSDSSAPTTVPLDPAVSGDLDLLATLHLDDGDGVLDPATDPVVRDEDRDDRDDDEDDGDDDQVRERFDYRVG